MIMFGVCNLYSQRSVCPYLTSALEFQKQWIVSLQLVSKNANTNGKPGKVK